MSNERPDQFMMIGLHKLASQFGDGLVPELYELLSRRARMIEDNPKCHGISGLAGPPAGALRIGACA